MAKQIAYNMDCMEAMRDMPDKAFELAIVDPPYGINISNTCGKRKHNSDTYKKFTWDKSPPPNEYFEELFRVSKNQIIWGANYFVSKIIKDTPCWIVWDKQITGNVPFAECELAWCSKSSSARVYRYAIQASKGKRIHPTQKPVALYEWLLNNYAKAGDRILDTHLGSGSSRIAAHSLGFDFAGYEIDTDYFNAQEERFQKHTAQVRLFDLAPEPTEEQLQII